MSGEPDRTSTREAGKGIPFVIAAPSGTGKTTVCHKVLEEDSRLRFSVSYTTRTPRAGEQDGQHYHFVAPSDFRRLLEQGAFLEHAEYNGTLYGTSEEALEEFLAEGYDVLIEIEVQGARQIRRRRSDARFIFLLPPSMDVLEQRLRTRGTDDEEAVQQRLAVAHLEVAGAEIFDYAVVNDDLSATIAAVREIIRSERAGCTVEAKRRFGRELVMSRWEAGSGFR